jgi:hypothetical protein
LSRTFINDRINDRIKDRIKGANKTAVTNAALPVSVIAIDIRAPAVRENADLAC